MFSRRLISGFALCICVLFLTSCGGEYLPEKYLYKARVKKQQLNPRKADEKAYQSVIDAFRKVTNKWPLSSKAADAHYEIAQLLVMQNKYDKARNELETLMINFSNRTELAADAKFAIGQLYEKEGSFDKAFEVYTEVYNTYPLTKKGLYTPLYIAELYKKLKRFQDATDAYSEALLHYSKVIQDLGEIKMAAVVQNYRALTYASQGLWKEAVAAWEIIPQKYPNSLLVAPTLLTLGEVYFIKLKERTKSLEIYESIIDKFPGTKFALRATVKIVQINFFTGSYAEAIAWCNTLYQMAGNDDELKAQALTIKARCMEKEGEWQSAEEIYEKIMSDYPNTQAALRVPMFMALHYEGMEDESEADVIYDNAISEYKKIIEDTEKSDQVRQNAFDLMNMVYAKQQNWDKIINNLQGVIDNEELTDNRKARALFLMGYIKQYRIKNNDAAKEIYDTFIEKYPEHPYRKAVEAQLSLIEKDIS